jgi:hypothetical protein
MGNSQLYTSENCTIEQIMLIVLAIVAKTNVAQF